MRTFIVICHAADCGVVSVRCCARWPSEAKRKARSACRRHEGADSSQDVYIDVTLEIMAPLAEIVRHNGVFIDWLT